MAKHLTTQTNLARSCHCILSKPQHQSEVDGQLHAPATLPPVQLHRILGGLHSRLESVTKMNQKKYIKYMVGTQLYTFTQISTYNYMFRLCILAIVGLYYKLNK